MTARLVAALRILAVPLLASAFALFAGLAPDMLRTGRVNPLDWLLPGCAAFVVMLLVAARGGRWPGWLRLALYAALALVAPLLLCALTPAAPPWPRMAVLALGLVLAALALGWTARRGRSFVTWAVAGLCLLASAGLGWGAYLLDQPLVLLKRSAATTGVMSALPLFTHGAGGQGALDVGGRAPILAAQERAAVPVDLIDAASLASLDRLLLAQPRLLAPAELVALDGWVRRGGHVVILADPLLHWPAAGGLTDARRPPLTSLLDPLLTHWGLTLEPAHVTPGAPVERRILSGGALLQLAGAARFTLAPDSPCATAEGGLFATCRIGAGRAVLAADADWIDDGLWTLDPTDPRDGRHWTSDAAPILAHLLRGAEGLPQPRWPWLVSQQALIAALRWSLLLILLLAIALALLGPIPSSAHVRPRPQRRPDAEPAGPSHDSG